MAFFAASVDSAETNKKFAESLDLDYPILSDPEKKVAKAYGVLAILGYAKRWTFYIDKEGIIRKIDDDVKPAEHGKAVAKALEELGVLKRK